MTDLRTAAPGALTLRAAPAGMPDPTLQPPVLAESGDPFAAVRVLELLARIERNRATRLADVVAWLNSRYLDWLFSPGVVADVILQLQANWMADYRNSSGIVLEDSPYGLVVTIEDSSRVDPWIVRQALREASACRHQLEAFSRRDEVNGDG